MAKAETEKPNSHCQERVSLYSFLHPAAKIPQQQQICLCTTESSCTADTAQLGTGHRKSSTWGSRIHLPHRRDLQSWSFIYSLRLWRHLWRTASSGIKATSTLLTRPWRRRPASGRLSWWGWGRDTSGRAEGSARRPRTARRACRTAGLRRAPQRWLLQRHPPDPARHPSLALPQPRASPLSSSMRAELASSSCSPYPASARNDFPPAAIANPATVQRARTRSRPPATPAQRRLRTHPRAPTAAQASLPCHRPRVGTGRGPASPPPPNPSGERAVRRAPVVQWGSRDAFGGSVGGGSLMRYAGPRTLGHAVPRAAPPRRRTPWVPRVLRPGGCRAGSPHRSWERGVRPPGPSPPGSRCPVQSRSACLVSGQSSSLPLQHLLDGYRCSREDDHLSYGEIGMPVPPFGCSFSAGTATCLGSRGARVPL